uniref:ABC transmembrane type-1 domain-containing protein n=1 Tax=Lactuca sativa TaxID=4236 RepID=A0A9R1W8U2_LACSA|nr:hypothetical protein LSAT_V11C300102360 [Lactuca sativa]
MHYTLQRTKLSSLMIQKLSTARVPVLLMNMSIFGGAYVVAFILLWRLAIVGLPFIIILAILGLIYGRVLMSLSRKIREEYNMVGTVAEQAISSVRTVYSFVGENKTITEYSAALLGTVKLGLKQGWAKGKAIGSNGDVFAVWSFLSWYGSRMVMYNGASRGTVFVVRATIAIGGLYCGEKNMERSRSRNSARTLLASIIKNRRDGAGEISAEMKQINGNQKPFFLIEMMKSRDEDEIVTLDL